MNNFWNRSNSPTSGPLFGKKSSVGLTAAATPPPKASSGRLPAATSPPPAGSPGKLGFDHDFACGVLVGAFAIPAMSVTVDQVEFTDPTSKKTERYEHWLRPNDMLAILTREYGKTQQRLAGQLSGKERDEANRRLGELRDQVVCVLHSRRAYHRAKELNVRVLIEA